MWCSRGIHHLSGEFLHVRSKLGLDEEGVKRPAEDVSVMLLRKGFWSISVAGTHPEPTFFSAKSFLTPIGGGKKGLHLRHRRGMDLSNLRTW
jgi:hypothetical protein